MKQSWLNEKIPELIVPSTVLPWAGLECVWLITGHICTSVITFLLHNSLPTLFLGKIVMAKRAGQQVSALRRKVSLAASWGCWARWVSWGLRPPHHVHRPPQPGGTPYRGDAFQPQALTTNETTCLLWSGFGLCEKGCVYMGFGLLWFLSLFARLRWKMNMLIWNCLSFPKLDLLLLRNL